MLERITYAKNTIYCGQTVNKGDAWCRTVTAEEAEKAVKRSHHAKIAADAKSEREPEKSRFSPEGAKGEDCAPGAPQGRMSMPEQTNTIQNNSEQIKTDQIKSDQNKCITEEYSTKPHGASVLALPLNDNSEFEIYEEDVLLWQETYPAVDVRQELKEMKAWCAANPSLRKTRRGIKRFIVTWLSKEQDKGGAGARGTKAAKPRREFVPTEL